MDFGAKEEHDWRFMTGFVLFQDLKVPEIGVRVWKYYWKLSKQVAQMVTSLSNVDKNFSVIPPFYGTFFTE